MDSLKGSQDPQGFPGHTLRTADQSNEIQEKANGGEGWGTENGQVVVVSDVSETAIHECLRSSPGLQMPSL